MLLGIKPRYSNTFLWELKERQVQVFSGSHRLRAVANIDRVNTNSVPDKPEAGEPLIEARPIRPETVR